MVADEEKAVERVYTQQEVDRLLDQARDTAWAEARRSYSMAKRRIERAANVQPEPVAEPTPAEDDRPASAPALPAMETLAPLVDMLADHAVALLKASRAASARTEERPLSALSEEEVEALISEKGEDHVARRYAHEQRRPRR